MFLRRQKTDPVCFNPEYQKAEQANKELHERALRVKATFSTLFASLFGESHGTKNLSDTSARVWLHHINRDELGGGIEDEKGHVTFGIVRREKADILTIADRSTNPPVAYEYALHENETAHLGVRSLDGTTVLPSSEVVTKGIERLEEIANTIGKIASSQTVTATIS